MLYSYLSFPIIACDAVWCGVVCQSVQATAAESSFYGDREVQTLSTANAHVTAGTFTVAYGAFSLQLPGTVSGYSLATAFTTTADLSPYLAPGDQIVVDGRTYTVAPYKFINRYLSTPLSFSQNQAAVVIHILAVVLACVFVPARRSLWWSASSRPCRPRPT